MRLRSNRRSFARRTCTVATVAAAIVLGAGWPTSAAVAADRPAAASGSLQGAPLASLLPANIRAMGTITVPSSIEFPPFEYFVPGTTTATGLDVDIMNAIGRELGLKFKFLNFKFESIIPSIQNGRFVIAMSSMSDTTSREKQVDFVDYFVDGEQMMVKAGNPDKITSYAELSGKPVALAVGDTDLTVEAQVDKKLAAQHKPPMHGLVLPGTPQDLLAIQSGRAVATIVDAASGAYDVKTTHSFEMTGPIVDTGPYGIDFPKGAKQFEHAAQAALNAIKKSGTYSAILNKWGEGAGAINSFTTNAAAAYGQ